MYVTEHPKLSITLRATRAVPELGLAPGQEVTMELDASEPLPFDFGVIGFHVAKGTLVAVSQPLDPCTVLLFTHVLLARARIRAGNGFAILEGPWHSGLHGQFNPRPEDLRARPPAA